MFQFSKFSKIIHQFRSNLWLVVICMIFTICVLYKTSYTIQGDWQNNINGNSHPVNDLDLIKNWMNPEESETKLILYATTFFRMNDFKFGLGSEPFKKHGCEYDNCYLTDSTSEISEDNFHAVVLHGPEFQFKDIQLPTKRKESQIYVYLSLEAPIRFPVGSVINNKGFFNATCTYRLDSDLPMPYYNIYNKKGEIIAPTNEQPNWMQEEMDNDFIETKLEMIKTKNKPVAWFVSNCNSHTNRRMENVKELQKYIPVDIFGKCGNLSCPNGDERCFEMLKKDYYFYLAYENSNCVDYVSERFPFALNSGVISIGYGGANYSKFAPPNSYIDASDYNAEGLAKMIKYLIDNPREYVKYFWWEKYYTVGVPVTPNFCGLCKYLNQPIKYKSYSNLAEWWEGSAENPACKRIT